MAVSDIDAVLEFLRKNGLSESESALMEDILDKSQVGSFDFERFMFPMVSPPPPLKIPTAAHEGLVEENPGPIGSCSASSDNDDDEFVSLGRSSTTDLCSSDFTNPYGIRIATGTNSRESSDRMSQFGTARDYYDFDMQNDLYWHEENYSLTPHLSDTLDPYGIEDKYEIEENHSNNYLDKSLSFEVESMKNDAKTSDFYGFRTENVEFEDDFERKEKMGCFDEEIDGKIDDLVGSDEVSMDDNKEEEYEVFDLRIIHRKNRTGFEENRDLPIILNAIIAGRYFVTEYLGSAAFSKVVQAHDLQTGIEVCLKIIKNNKDFFDQSLDEIKLLKFVNKHDPNDERHILRLYDYFYHQEHLFIVCELLRANLYEFQKYNRESGGEPYFTMKRIQVIARQCLEALDYLHSLGIIHCDLKPENILIKSYRRCEIKVIDLGSSCFNSDHLCFYVQSRSYRAPEVILGLPYDHKIDLWSLGCILAELCSGEVLFPNEEVAMLLGRVIGLLGPIDLDMLTKGQETDKYFTNEYDLYHINEDTKQMEYIIPDESSSLEHHLQVTDTLFIDFLRDLLEINPNRRPTAREALGHPWLSHSYDFDSLYL